MKIHIRQMEGGRLSIHGTESAADFGLEEAGVEPTGDLRYEIEAGLSEGGLWAHGKLSLPVRLLCVRCLEKFPSSIEVPDFALQIELDGNESVDLTPHIREDIFLALSPYPKCDAVENSTCPFGNRPAEWSAQDSQNENAGTGERPCWSALDGWKPKPTNR